MNISDALDPDVDGPLTEVLRAGARQLLEQAVEAELEAFLAAYAERKTEDGRQRLVRHGDGPERAVLTGIGSVPVRRAKARDQCDDEIARLKSKLGDVTMDNGLLQEKIKRLEARTSPSRGRRSRR